MAERAVRRSRRIVTREEILDAAVALVDAEGLGALSMRRLADALGVGAMTVYGFVENKDDLVASLGAHVLAGVEAQVDESGSWRDQMLAELSALRAALDRHPGLLELLSVGTDHMPLLDRTRERLLGILRAEGIDDEAVVDGLGSLVALTLGFVEGARLRSGPLSGSYDELRSLSVDEFPHLRAVADQYATHWSDRAWRFGAAALLDAIEARRDDLSR